jgi:Aldo/keto reductase family
VFVEAGGVERLAIDHVDLYRVHGPHVSTSLEEAVEFFERAVASGTTTQVCASNLPGWQIAAAHTLAHHAISPSDHPDDKQIWRLRTGGLVEPTGVSQVRIAF